MEISCHLNALTKLRTSKLCLLLDLAFLKKCRNRKILPNFITRNFSSKLQGIHIKKRIIGCQSALLRASIKDIRHRLATNERTLYLLHQDLLFFYNPIVWTLLDSLSWDKAETASIEKKNILCKKFRELSSIKAKYVKPPSNPPTIPFPPHPSPIPPNSLTPQLAIPTPLPPPPEIPTPPVLISHTEPSFSAAPGMRNPSDPTTKIADNVINLSDIDITPDTAHALSLGQNFAHYVPKSIFLENLVCSLDYGLSRHLDHTVALSTKYEVCSLINDFSDKPHISPSPCHLIKKLLKEDVFITRADKGGSLVVLSKSNYDLYITKLLNDSSTYEKIQNNPTNKLVNTLKQTVNACSSISEKTKKSLIPSAHHLPKFYGLPKIHKPDLSFRPIVSKTNSLNHPCAKFVSSKISPICNFNSFTVKNSVDFISKIKNISLNDDDLLVSFDVSSLYTSVPTNEAIAILEDGLRSILKSPENEISDILSLTALCVQNTYFKFRDNIYKQSTGLAMGCPLSSTLADVFMNKIDSQINSLSEKPNYWIRYVDDIFAIWPHGLNRLHLFLNKINSLHPNIKFTLEIENNRCLPFLDTLIFRNPDNTLSSTVYRKPTSNNSPIHISSSHPFSQKTSTFYYFVNRAFNLCSSPPLLRNEIDTIKNLAVKTGFSPDLIDNFVKKRRNKDNIKATTSLRSLKEPPSGYITIPYIPGLSGKIGNLIKKTGLTPIYKPLLKTLHLCNNFKDKTPNSEASGIYRIPCLNCNNAYIGQTKRNFKIRLNEHMLASGFKKDSNRYSKNKLKVNNSAVAAHRLNNNTHRIDWKNSKIINKCPNHLLNIFEKLYIFKEEQTMNKSEDNSFPSVWRPLFH